VPLFRADSLAEHVVKKMAAKYPAVSGRKGNTHFKKIRL
jgi:hypothetical protein